MKSDPKSYVLGLLSRREYSRSELVQKLRLHGVEASESEALLDEFAENGWQSDERYAEMYCRSQLSKRRGIRRIQQGAFQKGLSEALIKQALAELEPDWLELLEACYLKKYSSFDEENFSFEEKQKRIKYLMSQGYELDLIREFID